MKRHIVLAALFSLLVIAGCGGRHHEPRTEITPPTQRLHQLNHHLGLSMEQVEAIKPIIDDDFQEKTRIMELMKDGDDEEKQMAKYALEDLEWETFKRLCEHLTQEQIHLLSEFLLQEQQAMAPEPEPEQQRSSQGGRRGPRP